MCKGMHLRPHVLVVFCAILLGVHAVAVVAQVADHLLLLQVTVLCILVCQDALLQASLKLHERGSGLSTCNEAHPRPTPAFTAPARSLSCEEPYTVPTRNQADTPPAPARCFIQNAGVRPKSQMEYTCDTNHSMTSCRQGLKGRRTSAWALYQRCSNQCTAATGAADTSIEVQHKVGSTEPCPGPGSALAGPWTSWSDLTKQSSVQGGAR